MRYFDAPDLKDVGNNGYRFVNAVSDFATHSTPRRKTANYKENIFARTADGNPMIDRHTSWSKQHELPDGTIAISSFYTEYGCLIVTASKFCMYFGRSDSPMLFSKYRRQA